MRPSGNFGLRVGSWKLVRLEKKSKTQAVVSKDGLSPPTAKHTLYNLDEDPGELTDVSAAHPEILSRLTAQLDTLISGSRSRPVARP